MTTLKILGLRIQLGHDVGTACTNRALPAKDEFVVLNINGIHSISLVFCDCQYVEQRYVQPLRAGLFPATTPEPKTAATFSILIPEVFSDVELHVEDLSVRVLLLYRMTN